MPFKIVMTLEEGEETLCIVPSKWEHSGYLKCPKQISDYKYYRNENFKANANWPLIPCQVKRSAICTYKQAVKLLNEMLCTNTNFTVSNEDNEAHETVNDNTLVEHLILNGQNEQQTNLSFTTTARKNENVQILEYLQSNHSLLLNFLEVYNKSLEIQNKISQKLDTLIDSHKKCTHEVRSLKEMCESAGVNPLNMCDPEYRESLDMKPIDTVEELERLELMLSDRTQKHRLAKKISILCTTSIGNGITCAYKLLDVMFSREFLCKCSWSGGSRGKDVKIAFKGYQNVLTFFFDMVNSWDLSFTMEQNERFLKTVLKNSIKRKETKNIRASTQRNRANDSKSKRPKVNYTLVIEGEKASDPDSSGEINELEEDDDAKSGNI